jgi:hypothetical protein
LLSPSLALSGQIKYYYSSLLIHLSATVLCNFSYYYEVVCFLYNFHKTEETLLSFSNLEKIVEHQACHRTGAGKDSNVPPSAPMEGKGFVVEPED